MNTRIAFYIGLIILLIISAWLSYSFYTKEKYKQLSKTWGKEFESFEALEKSFPKKSANTAALELEKLCIPLGIELAPKDFDNRPRPEKKKREHIKIWSKDLSKILENRLNHETSEQIEIPAELENYLAVHQGTSEEIVSSSIANEPPIWELDLQKHVYCPFPNLSGHLILQRLINLKASLLIEESKFVEAERMLEASWKINEQLLKRPEEISYMIGQTILKLQMGNLRQMNMTNDIWNERLKHLEVNEHVWKVLEAAVVVVLKAADEGRIGLEEGEERAFYHYIYNIRLMALNWAEVMHSRILELKRRNPCSPMTPIKIGEEGRLFPSWNRVGSTMFYDPAYLWNRSMRLRLDLELTKKILEIKKKLHEDPESLNEGISLNSRLCKGEKWIFQKTTDGFKLTFSKNINWEVGEFPPNNFKLPDKYTSDLDKWNN